MFKNIKYEDIAYILSPLEMDLLYAISIIENTDYQTDIQKILEIKDFLAKYLEIFKSINLFNMFYVENLTVSGYCDRAYATRSKCNLIEEYIQNKRRILKGIIYIYYINYKKRIDIYRKLPNLNIPIIEDENKIYNTSLMNYEEYKQESDKYLINDIYVLKKIYKSYFI